MDASTLLSWLVNTSDFPNTDTQECFNYASMQQASKGFSLATFSLNLLDSTSLQDEAVVESRECFTHPPQNAHSEGVPSAGATSCCSSFGPQTIGSWDLLRGMNLDCPAAFPIFTEKPTPWGTLPPAAVDTRMLARVLAVCPPVHLCNQPGAQQTVASTPAFELPWPSAAWGQLPPANVDAELLRLSLPVCPAIPGKNQQQDQALSGSTPVRQLRKRVQFLAPSDLASGTARSASAAQKLEQAGSWGGLPPVLVCKELLMAQLSVCPSVLPTWTSPALLTSPSSWGGLPDAHVDTQLLKASLATCPSVWPLSINATACDLPSP